MKPLFYDKFICIADKCDFTCCQQWKIGVDDNTYENWKNIKKCDVCSYNGKCDEATDENTDESQNIPLSELTKIKDDQRVIALNEQMVCPLLRDDKLCSVVLAKGEETISETCHIFPREKHEFDNHTEDTLMPCCPYVIDLLNDEEKFYVIDEKSGKEVKAEDIPDEFNMDMGLFELRQVMMNYIQQKTGSKYLDNTSVDEMIKAIYYMLLECLEDGEYDPEKWILMPELIDTVRNMDSDIADNLNECNELFLDIIDNYLKEGLYMQYLSELSDEALKLESIICEEDGDESESDNGIKSGSEDISEEDKETIKADCALNADEEIKLYQEFLEKFRSYDSLIRKYLAQEFYADLFLPEGDIDSVVIHYQWIAMEYVIIRHMSYLEYRSRKLYDDKNDSIENDNNSCIPYKRLRDFIVLTSRIMGYEEDDIYEYLENSFEEIIWDWGYMGLIIG